MSQVVVIGIGVSLRPIDHQPESLQVSASLAQAVPQENLTPRNSGRLRLAAGRQPRAGFPRLSGKISANLGQRFGWRGVRAYMAPDSFLLGVDLRVSSFV